MLMSDKPTPGAPAVSGRRPKAVVIGSGFGGLAAAVRLGARGYAVTVLEKLDGPGGRAFQFTRDGHTFDAGPTIVTAPFLFEDLWRLCGRSMADDVELRPLDPFYRIRYDDGETLTCSGVPEAMRAEIRRLSPDDVVGYQRFLADSEKIFRMGFEDSAHVPFHDPRAMLSILPDFVRRRAWRSVHRHISSRVKDERLRVGLGFHPLFIGGNPLGVTCIYSLIAHLERTWGVHWAMGGTGALVRGLVSLIAARGGEIRYGAQVEEITVEGRRATGVRLVGGQTLDADVVVSNADSAWTYRHLLPGVARKRWTDRRIDRAKYSMSLFVWYFGTSERYDDLPHHTIVLGPRYQGLITDIFKRHVLPEDMSLYLHRPTATDPALAPPGRDTFYVLSPVPHLDADVDWATHAEPYRRMVQKRLEETVMPGLGARITTSHVTTPLDFRDRLLSVKGAAFGLEPRFAQSAWFRPHNRSEEVDGLYLVGAGTHPGAGLPGVLSSARILDTVVPDAATFV